MTTDTFPVETRREDVHKVTRVHKWTQERLRCPVHVVGSAGNLSATQLSA